MKNDHAIRTLGELIDINREGEEEYRICARRASDASVRRLFIVRARQCADAAQELRRLVRQLGGGQGVGTAGTAQRNRADPQDAQARDDDALLEECERGEDRALEIYRNALDDQHLPDFVRQVVLRQFESVMSSRDRIRGLRVRHARPESAARDRHTAMRR